MSEENLEIVRGFIAALNKGDWAARMLEFVDEDVEIDWSRSPAPYRGVYRGREGALKFAEETDVWDAARIEPGELIDAGDDVLVPHVIHLRGRDGIEVRVRATYVYTFRDGLCVRWSIYQEHEDALEALGLSE